MAPDGSDDVAILTLEPLIDAVREAVEGAGWTLSGLQKTTSHQFEGRWDGESTRSAYLFHHSDAAGDAVGIDVYLDETSRGLTGNLALVVDLAPLRELGGAEAVLARLAELSADTLSSAHRRPLTLRLRVADAADDIERAETEVRFKLRIPRKTIAAGSSAVRDLSVEAVRGFEEILRVLELRALIASE